MTDRQILLSDWIEKQHPGGMVVFCNKISVKTIFPGTSK